MFRPLGRAAEVQLLGHGQELAPQAKLDQGRFAGQPCIHIVEGIIHMQYILIDDK
jgi:hypothetical protein